jgi:hypothetical protein
MSKRLERVFTPSQAVMPSLFFAYEILLNDGILARLSPRALEEALGRKYPEPLL